MSEIQKDGSTRRENLLVVKKTTGKLPKELEDEPQLDEMFQESWYWFLSLNSKRQVGQGVNPIPYSEIKAYFDLMQYQPMQYELDLIDLFDNIAVTEYSKQLEKQTKANSK